MARASSQLTINHMCAAGVGMCYVAVLLCAADIDVACVMPTYTCSSVHTDRPTAMLCILELATHTRCGAKTQCSTHRSFPHIAVAECVPKCRLMLLRCCGRLYCAYTVAGAFVASLQRTCTVQQSNTATVRTQTLNNLRHRRVALAALPKLSIRFGADNPLPAPPHSHLDRRSDHQVMAG